MKYLSFLLFITVQQLLEEGGSPTPQLLADLQSLAAGLLESVNDKNLALSHQRKTNKYVDFIVVQ